MQMRIPLFPLQTVLFPGQVLPLHIFEPRYRQMIGECLQQSAPFGVALIREGQEAGTPATPMHVGTTARIAQVQSLPDGRMNILTIGESRFRIDTVHADRPYLEATATLLRWPDEESSELQPLAGSVLTLLQRFMLDVGEEANRKAIEEITDNPLLVATAAAAVPGLSLAERQRLLELPTLKDLLLREAELLEQEHTLIRVLRGTEPLRPDPDTLFNPN
jgi:Lon protease-like protein